MASSSFKKAEKILEHAIEELREVKIITSDFHYRCQDILQAKVQNVATSLRKLNAIKEGFGDVQIPLELVDFVDSGRSPARYSQQLSETVQRKKEEHQEVIKSFSQLKEKIIEEMSEAYPTILQQYFTIRQERPKESESSEYESDTTTSDENQMTDSSEHESGESPTADQPNDVEQQGSNESGQANGATGQETVVSNQTNPTLLDNQNEAADVNMDTTEQNAVEDDNMGAIPQLEAIINANRRHCQCENKENIDYLNIRRQ